MQERSPRGTKTVVSVGSETVVFDGSSFNVLDLTAAASSNMFVSVTNIRPGEDYTIIFRQGVGGAATFGFSGVTIVGFDPNVDPSSNSVTVINFRAVSFSSITMLGMPFSGSSVFFQDCTTQTTVGAAGAATALPAQPVGYIEVSINGAARVIPFYLRT